MLQTIDDANFGHAVDLLVRGFPRASRQIWEQSLERLRRYNQYNGDSSLGQLLVTGGRPAGIMLTLCGHSHPPKGAPFKVTNLSSWYVEPEHRQLAALMLMNLVRDRETVFTDLSPSDRVLPMLPPLGFKPLNRGLSAVSLPVAGLHPAGDSYVRPLAAAQGGALPPRTRTLLERHAEFGATAGVLTAGGRSWPLLFISRSVRGLPAAQLIYCEDTQVLHQHIAAVARFLLKQKKLMLILDIPLDGRAPGVHFPNRGMKFAKGGSFGNRTDYTGSELLFFKP